MLRGSPNIKPVFIPYFINVLISFHKWNVGSQTEKGIAAGKPGQTQKPPGSQEAR